MLKIAFVIFFLDFILFLLHIPHLFILRKINNNTYELNKNSKEILRQLKKINDRSLNND